MASQKSLSEQQTFEILNILKKRFDLHKNRHLNMDWTKIEEKLNDNPSKLWSLYQMEISGGDLTW